MNVMKLILVEPQPDYIESSGRWCWPLPDKAIFPGCCTNVYTASREWWEYAPSEAKPHPMAQGVKLRDGIWYWAVPDAAHSTEHVQSPGESLRLALETINADALAAWREQAVAEVVQNEAGQVYIVWKGRSVVDFIGTKLYTRTTAGLMECPDCGARSGQHYSKCHNTGAER